MTGEPELSTTTVLALAAATAATRASWSPGSDSVGPILALGLEVLVGADDHDRRVGFGGHLCCPADRVIGGDETGADGNAAEHLAGSEGVVDFDVVALSGFELERRAPLRRGVAEDGPAAFTGSDLDHDVAVDPQRRRSDRQQADLPCAAVARNEPAARSPAEVERIQLVAVVAHRWLLPQPLQPRPGDRDGVARSAAQLDDELAVGVDHRQRLADEATGLERHVVAAGTQRVQRSDGPFRADLGTAAALTLALGGVGTDQRQPLRRQPQGQESTVVLQQHCGGDRGPADQRPRRLDVAGDRLRLLVGAHPLGKGGDPGDGAIEGILRRRAGSDLGGEFGAPVDRRPGHLDIESGAQTMAHRCGSRASR